LPPALYVVATPIGNAMDITLRALDVLRTVDRIACEDTRVTAKLLAIHGVARPLTSYREHNAARAGPLLVERIRSGERVALVCDAGTPLVSDPEQRLVRACVEAGQAVVPIPGVSSLTAALSIAALPAERVLFAGFLPAKTAARIQAIRALAEAEACLVVLEAPHRLARTLRDLASELGPRQAVVGRELTKLHEEVRRGTLVELAAAYADEGTIKGEITLVVAPPGPRVPDRADAVRRIEALVAAGASAKDAASEVAAATGMPRRTLYALALDRKNPANEGRE
jgi:16S rRNA (cytidine1402-2'-O)-methyltransferase